MWYLRLMQRITTKSWHLLMIRNFDDLKLFWLQIKYRIFWAWSSSMKENLRVWSPCYFLIFSIFLDSWSNLSCRRFIQQNSGWGLRGRGSETSHANPRATQKRYLWSSILSWLKLIRWKIIKLSSVTLLRLVSNSIILLGLLLREVLMFFFHAK